MGTDVQIAPGTWSDVMGIRLITTSETEVVAELDVERKHLQSFGLVHGGVYCGLIETIASVGATLAARASGRVVSGIENQTSFVRAVKSGTLRGRATPLHIGKTTQLWTAELRLVENGELCASGKVRLVCTDKTL